MSLRALESKLIDIHMAISRCQDHWLSPPEKAAGDEPEQEPDTSQDVNEWAQHAQHLRDRAATMTDDEIQDETAHGLIEGIALGRHLLGKRYHRKCP